MASQINCWTHTDNDNTSPNQTRDPFSFVGPDNEQNITNQTSPVGETILCNGTAPDTANDLIVENKHSYMDTTTSMNQSSLASSKEDSQLCHPKRRPWKPTVLCAGALSGLFCLCLAMTSIVASLGVLVGSRNKPVPTWSLEPSAYLAIFTAIGNQSMRYASIQGVAIAWWFRATRGSTLARLHYDYRSGMTIKGAITSGRHMGLLGLACIFSTLVAMDGPLLQKATTVVSSPIVNEARTLDVKIAQEVPKGFTGGWAYADQLGQQLRFSSSFNKTIPTSTGNISNSIIPQYRGSVDYYLGRPWFLRTPLSGFIQGCPESCNATIRAPAFAKPSCRTSLIPVNYTQPVVVRTILDALEAPPLNTNQFMVDISLNVEEEYESLNIITAFAKTESCSSGVLNMTMCTLRPAIAEYSVTITNNSATLAPDLPKIVALANNTLVDHEWDKDNGWYPSTLAGILEIAWARWHTNVIIFNDEGYYQSVLRGTDAYEGYIENKTPDNVCGSYLDPLQDVLWSLNELMFLTGITAATLEDGTDLGSSMDPDLPLNTTVVGELLGTHNIYHTNLHWFFAAAAVELICIAFVAPTYWGWWKLGRSVSFSPLETAKAFEAPLLTECYSNSSGRDIAKAVGDVPIKYGQTNAHTTYGGEIKKIAFSHPTLAAEVQSNTYFDV